MTTGERAGNGDTEGGEGSGDGGEDEVPTVERAVTVISVAVTLALVGALVWQALTAPADVQPRVSVVGTEPAPDGDVEVTVEMVNRGSVGLAAATVELDCASPPPDTTFQHVPASGRREATLVCPADTTAVNATVTAWQEA